VIALLYAGLFRGERVPAHVLWVPVTFIAWYGFVAFAIRRGFYRGGWRWASTTIDVSLASAILLIDVSARGPVFALSAAGPVVYHVVVAAAAMRLTPRLSLFAGGFAATQSWLLTHFVLVPRLTAAEASLVAADPYIIALKSLFLIVVGVFGYIVTRSLREVLRRTSSHALERERVRNLFGMYMSEEVVEHILEGGVKEGGEKRHITVCFTDIRDFTSLSETRPPEEVLRLLNLYFERMCEIVARQGGLVNKFLGDGMLIVFGAPADLADDAARALAAAHEMVAEAARMNAAGEFPALRIGIGIHRGDTVVGNVGGAQRQEYTVIGDTVNTASRVQDLTKSLGRAILLTEEVARALDLPPGALEPLGQHPVKGREAPLVLYSPASALARTA
jgi:adenylate cyclase